MNKIIKCENLKKEYDKIEVLKGINLEIDEGDFCGIVGPSGSGKSTLLYLLSGLETPTSGKVFYKDNDIFSLTDDKLCDLRKNEFGFVFQFYNLIPNISVNDNIAFPMILKKLPKQDIKTKIDELLEKVSLTDKKRKEAFQLSGGEQQRVALARALAISPSIIFADEPTGNLDSTNSENIMEILKDINSTYKTTIVMVTHNESLLKYFNKVITIKDGIVI